jgi:predicted DNA-binding protein YlxM (UPF0122 family)
MRNFFKSTIVFLTVLSVAFMATSIAMYFGHPDMHSEMTSEAMKAYTFTPSAGETVTWSVTERLGAKTDLGSFASPLLAIDRAHRDFQTKLSAETADMKKQLTGDPDNPGVLMEIKRFQTSQAQDIEAARERARVLSGIAASLQTNLRQFSNQEQSLAEQAKQIQLETASRRTDVNRLQNELEEARTDLFRLTEIRRELTDELVRLQLDQQTLQERIDQVGGQ